MGPFWGFRGAARPKSSQAAQKGPDARRRAPRPPRRTLCTLRGAAALANEADGPFSAACSARATQVRLEIGHQATLEVDDDLVVRDVPVADGGQPPEAPALVRDGPAAAIDEGAAAGRLELLVLLVVRAAQREDLLV